MATDEELAANVAQLETSLGEIRDQAMATSECWMEVRRLALALVAAIEKLQGISPTTKEARSAYRRRRA